MNDYDDDPLLPGPKKEFPWPSVFLIGMIVICILGVIYSAAGGAHG